MEVAGTGSEVQIHCPNFVPIFGFIYWKLRENITILNGTRGAKSAHCVKSFIAHTCARTQISDFSLSIFKFVTYLTKFKGIRSCSNWFSRFRPTFWVLVYENWVKFVWFVFQRGKSRKLATTETMNGLQAFKRHQAVRRKLGNTPHMIRTAQDALQEIDFFCP